MQRARPSLAAIAGLVKPAIAAGSPHRALRGNVRNLRICRMQHDPADVLAGSESDVGPRLSRVVTLVNAITPADALPVRALTRTDPDDVGIWLEDDDVANRVHWFALEHGFPRDAGIARAEHAARR